MLPPTYLLLLVLAAAHLVAAQQDASAVAENPIGDVHFIQHETCLFQTALRPRRIFPNIIDLPFSVPGLTTNPGVETGRACAALCEHVPEAEVALYYAPDSAFAAIRHGNTGNFDDEEPGNLPT